MEQIGADIRAPCVAAQSDGESSAVAAGTFSGAGGGLVQRPREAARRSTCEEEAVAGISWRQLFKGIDLQKGGDASP